MNKKIRPMEISDLPKVMEIERQSFPSPWSEKTFRQELLRNRIALYLVVEDGEDILGYLGFWMVRGEIHITNLAVDPTCRRKGIASGLLAVVYKLARKNGTKIITLEVRASNQQARELYRKEGFEEKGVRRGYYRDSNEDAIIMTRFLKGEDDDE